MEQFLPYIVEALVVLGGIFGILKLTNNESAKKVGEKGDEIVDKLRDVLNPDTHGGTGRGPDDAAG